MPDIFIDAIIGHFLHSTLFHYYIDIITPASLLPLMPLFTLMLAISFLIISWHDISCLFISLLTLMAHMIIIDIISMPLRHYWLIRHFSFRHYAIWRHFTRFIDIDAILIIIFISFALGWRYWLDRWFHDSPLFSLLLIISPLLSLAISAIISTLFWYFMIDDYEPLPIDYLFTYIDYFILRRRHYCRGHLLITIITPRDTLYYAPHYIYYWWYFAIDDAITLIA